MSASVDRIGEAFRIGPRWVWPVALVALCGVAALVAVATRLGVLPLALGLAAVALLTVVGFRWPLLPLVVFAALIPIEEAAVVEGFGTMSRFAALLFLVAYGLPRIGRLAFGAMPAAGWAFLAWAIVSIGWAIDLPTAWGQLVTLLQLFLIALLVADFVSQRPEIVRPVLWVYSLSAAATAAISVAAFIGYGGDTRAAAIENQNPAQFAAVLLPAAVFGLYELASGSRRLIGAAVAGVTTVAIVFSGTRGAWVALLLALLLVLLPQLRPRHRIAAISGLAVLFVALYQIPGVPELLVERVGTALSSGGAGRTDIWSVGATIYQSAPLLGVGYANFPIAYTADVVRVSSVSSYTLSGAAPHNALVGTLVELGPIGLGLLVLFLVPLAVRRGWGPDAPVVQAALVSLLSMALFLDVVGNRKQVWLVIGLAAGLVYLSRWVKRAPWSGTLAGVGSSGVAPSEVNEPIEGPDAASLGPRAP